MRSRGIVIVLWSMLWIGRTEAQDTPPLIEHAPVHGNVHFEFTHSLRIPDYHITVDFYDRPWLHADSIEVRAISEPMPGRGWKGTASDRTFFISKAAYERVISAVNEIDVPKLNALSDLAIGNDGYTCTIKYGGFQNSVAIEVWVPEQNTKPKGKFEEPVENFRQMDLDKVGCGLISLGHEEAPIPRLVRRAAQA